MTASVAQLNGAGCWELNAVNHKWTELQNLSEVKHDCVPLHAFTMHLWLYVAPISHAFGENVHNWQGGAKCAFKTLPVYIHEQVLSTCQHEICGSFFKTFILWCLSWWSTTWISRWGKRLKRLPQTCYQTEVATCTQTGLSYYSTMIPTMPRAHLCGL